MKDIGRLDTRISHLEYYAALNALEKKTSSMTITDGNGLERFKNGILVDPFDGSGIVDVHNTDTRYKYSIDPYRQKLFPYVANEDNKTFKALLDSSVGVKGHVQNSVITLSYTNTAFIEQGIATTSISVNPYSVNVLMIKRFISSSSSLPINSTIASYVSSSNSIGTSTYPPDI